VALCRILLGLDDEPAAIVRHRQPRAPCQTDAAVAGTVKTPSRTASRARIANWTLARISRRTSCGHARCGVVAPGEDGRSGRKG
jgi:hypothetical protein